MGTQTESSPPLGVEVMLSAQALVLSGDSSRLLNKEPAGRGASNGCDTRAILQMISKPAN